MLLENYWNLIPTDFIYQVFFLAKLENLKVFNDQQLFFYLHYLSLIKYQREVNCHKFPFFFVLHKYKLCQNKYPFKPFQTICVTWSLHEVGLKQINCPQKPNNHKDFSF